MTPDTTTDSGHRTSTRRAQGWWRTDQIRADIAARYRTGRSIRGIAADLDCSYGTVHQALVLAQVTMRPRGGSRKRTGTAGSLRQDGART